MGLDGTCVRSEAGNLNVPMGSTKKVGESVRGGRVPEEYDSSPTLYSKRHKFSTPGQEGKAMAMAERIRYK